MSEPDASTDDLLEMAEQAPNLTYFAFAKDAVRQPAPAPTQASVGQLPQVLAGRYQLEGLLGAGGMGTVYRARDLLHEQYGEPSPYLAIKVLGEDIAGAPDASALLYSEFALPRHVRHDNVLRLYTFEVDQDSQLAFISMELMRGLTLDKLLCERPGGLPWNQLREIALPLLDALVCAHGRGVLHGDIKPSNVMLCDEGVRLFDFGLGQSEEGVLDGLPQLSRSRFNAWTPGYAAPELLDGQPLTSRADLFAVACVLYELAEGKHPFQRVPSNLAQAQGLHLSLRAPRHLPWYCWPALRAALSFDPQARSITAHQLRQAWHSRWAGARHWLGHVQVRRG